MAPRAASPAMREHRVDCGRLVLSVRDHAGGQPPIVALHGLASNARWWDLVAARLRPANRVCALDQRGHGRSDRPPGGYSLEAAVEDVNALHRALGLEPALLVGHSWGATVALAQAARHPEATLGVVCIDGGVTDLRSFFGDSWEVAEQAMRPPSSEGLSVAGLGLHLRSSALAAGSDLETALGILMGNFERASGGRLRPRLTLERHMELARALYHVDREALLRPVRRPVLIALAEGPEGPSAPAAAGMAAALEILGPLGRGLWIRGGHDLPVEHPAEVAEAIGWHLDWITGPEVA